LYADKTTFTGTQTFQDCSGPISVTGCKAPAGTPVCRIYSCNTTTGNCQINDTCACNNDGDCNDQNGCTTDKCIGSVYCQHTPIDCYSSFSNGSCPLNFVYSNSNATGVAIYSGSTACTATDPYGNPSPATGVPRTCDQLACYNGQPSTYQCLSTGNFSFTCNRTIVSSCTLSACYDTICQSVGQGNPWSGGNLQAGCNIPITPNCVSTACTYSSCNTSYSHGDPVSLRCITSSNSSNCVQSSKCFNYACNTPGGCNSTAVTVPVNTTCYGYYCDPTLGVQQVCTGPAKCPQNPANLCQVPYCSSGSCASVDKGTIQYGTTQTYTDDCGNTYPVAGCQTPTGSPYCVNYYCNQTTGNCVRNSTCQCFVDSDCYDSTGCTINKCVNYTCQTQTVDCFSYLSNGSCPLNFNYPTSSTTGNAFYTGTNSSSYSTVDANGNPFPASGIPRTCDQLACYGGQPSTYQCLSTGTANGNFSCQRTVTATCSLASCVDTICQSVTQGNSWSNLNAGCNVQITPTCTSNACLNSFCNTSYSHSDPVSLRCISQSNSSTCNPNTVCTLWSCDNTLGCRYYTPTLPTNNTCFQYYCDPVAGNITVEVGSKNCAQDTTNYCNITYCDPTSLSCKSQILTSFDTATTVSISTSTGANYTIVGCAKPSSDNAICRQYSCTPSTGQCVVNTSTCVCLTDTDCNDYNGCTIDTCDVTQNKCFYSNYDCFAYISVNSCKQNGAFTGSTSTGYNVWNNTAAKNLYIADPTTGLPEGYATFHYSCDQLACFGNQINQYYCNSTGNYNQSCVRTSSPCPSSGCADGRCQTYGNWSNNQIVADCTNYYYPTCISTDRCAVSYCNSSVSNARAPGTCFLVPYNVTTYCDDGNFCTQDKCDSNSTSKNPCYHVAYTEAVLRKTFCTKYSYCETVSCLVNTCIYTSINCKFCGLCTYFVCNATTNNTCVAVNSTVFKYDKCGVCNGNGLSCVIHGNVIPKGASIGAALGAGLGVSCFFALCAGIFAARKGYDKYKELSAELNGQVKVSEAYKGAEHGGENFGLRDSAVNLDK